MQVQICSVRTCVTIMICMSQGMRVLTFVFGGHELKEKLFRDIIRRYLRLKLTESDSVGGPRADQFNRNATGVNGQARLDKCFQLYWHGGMDGLTGENSLLGRLVTGGITQLRSAFARNIST